MTIDELVETFALLESWEDRYALIIDLGRKLEPLDADERTESTKVRGCMSQVWMVAEQNEGRMRFRGDSDAHIVKGLIAILLMIFSDRTPAEILATDIEAEFARLNLVQHVSVNRRNGLFAMVERIRSMAGDAHESPAGDPAPA